MRPLDACTASTARETTGRAQLWPTLAMCSECGETRVVLRRREGQRLRCDHCKKTTLHTPVRFDEWSVAEHINKRAGLSDVDVLGAVELLRALGARVRVAPFRIGSLVGIVEVFHYLDDRTFHITINPEADLERVRARALDAAEYIKDPERKQWFVGVTTVDGVPYAYVGWGRPAD